MPSKDTLLCLSYRKDVRPFAKLSETSKRVVFALLTDDGVHLSLHRKPGSSETHVEYSSRHPTGSVWDTARVGIAEKLGYPQPQKHACYVLTAPLRGARPSEGSLLSHRLTLDLFSSDMPARRARLPRICIRVPSASFVLSLHFSPDCSAVRADSTTLSTTLGNLSPQIEAQAERSSEPPLR
jgi:hypothetical protein